MPKKITDEQEQRIVKAYQTGKTQEQIAAVEFLSVSTISNIIKKHITSYERKCTVCGKVFTPTYRTTKYCDNCKVKVSKEYQKNYKSKKKREYIAKPKTESKQKSKVKSLDEVAKYIREQGITYAEYQLREG